MYRKTMREALEEARSYRDPVNEDKGFSSQQIKMAYGVLNDPRYKQGNYSGAYAAIEKIAKGLASHPDVANALKRANENLEERFTKKEFDRNEDENDHSLNAIMLAKEFGTSQEIKDMEAIDKRHKQRGHIEDPDYSKRNALVRKYYPRLK